MPRIVSVNENMKRGENPMIGTYLLNECRVWPSIRAFATIPFSTVDGIPRTALCTRALAVLNGDPNHFRKAKRMRARTVARMHIQRSPMSFEARGPFVPTLFVISASRRRCRHAAPRRRGCINDRQ